MKSVVLFATMGLLCTLSVTVVTISAQECNLSTVEDCTGFILNSVRIIKDCGMHVSRSTTVANKIVQFCACTGTMAQYCNVHA